MEGLISPALVQLAGRTRAHPVPKAPERLKREQAIFEGKQAMENLNAVGKPSGLTCPDCGGGLWELSDTRPLRYRCHTGHGFSSRSLENAQVDHTEQALWSSVRSLREREILLRRLAVVAEVTGDLPQAEAGRRQADKVKSQAEQLSRIMEREMNSA